MPQKAGLPPPPGFTVIDEGFTPEKQKADTAPPVKPPAPPPAFSQGAGPISTVLSEMLGPFSARDSSDSWKIPDVISGSMDMMRRNLPGMAGSPGMKEQINSAVNKNVDQRAGEVVNRGKNMVRGMYEPSQKIGSGDPQMAAEGFGQALSQALQMILLSKAAPGESAPTGAPAPPPEWQGPVQPPPEWQGPKPPTAQMMMGPKAQPAPQLYGPRSAPTPPVKLPAQLNAAPNAPDVIDVPYRTSAHGPSGTVHNMPAPVRGLINPPRPPLSLPSADMLSLPEGPQGPLALPSGGARAIPAGSDSVPIQPDPRLPHSYSNIPAGAPTAQPGIMGKVNLGEEGGIPSHGEQTVTPVKPKPTRGESGAYRKGTPSELLSQSETPGRTASNAVMLPNGKVHIPSSLEMERGYVIYNGEDGQFTKFPLDANAPKPPTKSTPKPKGK